MRKIVALLLSMALLWSCNDLGSSDPYKEGLVDVHIILEYPAGFESSARQGVVVTLEDINLSTRYELPTDEFGELSCRLPLGLYRISTSQEDDDDIFNGTLDRQLVNTASDFVLKLSHSGSGAILIKEIYCGGCMKYPEQGNYQSDQYIILHNNVGAVQYLDGLCLGTLAPYNSNSNNPYGSVLPDYLPIIQAVWQFPGDGDDFPLQPGEDAVVCLRGAIDHKAQYELSVNLNKEGYFVCYNPTYFPNPTYHPVPGNNISESHWLEVLVKTGQANAYTFSINSPAVAVFRPSDGSCVSEYLQGLDAIEQLPGSTSDRVAKIPFEWVVDAVEVFNGSSSSNSKRLVSELDAGYVTLSSSYLGHTLMRRVNEAKSAEKGYEVLRDRNNSSLDFYEREIQSLNEK